jgi:hypothetical protein
MAVDAAADREHELAVGKVGLMLRHRRARQTLGFAQQPKSNSSQHHDQCQKEKPDFSSCAQLGP